jgi:putative hydrolase of the HAD superfamily
MQDKPYLLFDAGGTIVYPDPNFLIRETRKRGIELTHNQLYEGYYKLIYSLDCQARNCPDHSFPAPWPKGYAYHLFETLNILCPDTEAVADIFWTYHLYERNLWAFTFDWVRKTLDQLAKQGYRMSVISNSDTRTEIVLRDVKLAHFFEHIFDSKLLGVDKPDPRIFEIVLDKLNLLPEDALYIGDIYYVDVLGANLAGLGGIHIDPLKLYRTWPGVHLTDIREMPDWLAQYTSLASTSALLNQEATSHIQTHSFVSQSTQSVKLNTLVPLAGV